MSSLPTPIGSITITGNDRSICRIDFGSKKRGTLKSNPLEKRCMKELCEYFSGKRTSFSIPIAITGTPFQRKVIRAMQAIPFGETRTYAEIARAIGKPTAVRAVGSACGANPIPIVIPCHRVVGSHDIGGYSGGIRKKLWLIKHEES